jgi:hypothetical protein
MHDPQAQDDHRQERDGIFASADHPSTPWHAKQGLSRLSTMRQNNVYQPPETLERMTQGSFP